MFDFGIDKMIVVAVLVGLILGPERLRDLRRSLPQHLGRLHALYLQGRAQVVDELNELAPDWREYDPRQLHPRRIIQDLNAAAAASATEGVSSAVEEGESPAHAGDADRVAQSAVPSTDAGGPDSRIDEKRNYSHVGVAAVVEPSSCREVAVIGAVAGSEERGTPADVSVSDPVDTGTPHVSDEHRESGPLGDRDG